MQVQGKVQRDAVGQLQVEQGCGWHLLCDQLARAGEGGGNHNIEAALLQRVLDRAIQLHGALGMTDDTPLAYWYRHERAARIYDGADEVHKSVVARRILKGYGGSALE